MQQYSSLRTLHERQIPSWTYALLRHPRVYGHRHVHDVYSSVHDGLHLGVVECGVGVPHVARVHARSVCNQQDL